MPDCEKSAVFACYYMNTSDITTDMVSAFVSRFVTLNRGYPINLARGSCMKLTDYCKQRVPMRVGDHWQFRDGRVPQVGGIATLTPLDLSLDKTKPKCKGSFAIFSGGTTPTLLNFFWPTSNAMDVHG
jgi:hypothetical protein